jgi:DNA modification methylase
MLAGIRNRLGGEPNHLLDPFAGTGAAVSAARQLGIPSTGIELSHLGILIARVRLWPPASPERAVQLVDTLIAGSKTRRAQVPQELVSWIGPENARLLSGWLPQVMRVRNSRLRRFLLLSLSAALRPASRWLPGSIKPQEDPTRDPPPLADQWKRAARSIARDCLLEKPKAGPVVRATVLRRNALKPGLPESSVDAVLTSPPYYTTYNYFDVHRLTHLAFGWPRVDSHQIGRMYRIAADGRGFVPPSSMRTWYAAEFRREDTVKGRALREYLQRLQEHLQAMRTALKPGSVVCYAIANSTRHGRIFPLVATFEELLSQAGFRDIQSDSRTVSSRRILPPGRDNETGRFSSESKPAIQEHIVFAQRGGR